MDDPHVTKAYHGTSQGSTIARAYNSNGIVKAFIVRICYKLQVIRTKFIQQKKNAKDRKSVIICHPATEIQAASRSHHGMFRLGQCRVHLQWPPRTLHRSGCRTVLPERARAHAWLLLEARITVTNCFESSWRASRQTKSPSSARLYVRISWTYFPALTLSLLKSTYDLVLP